MGLSACCTPVLFPHSGWNAIDPKGFQNPLGPIQSYTQLFFNPHYPIATRQVYHAIAL